jgi:hypothetical protein
MCWPLQLETWTISTLPIRLLKTIQRKVNTPSNIGKNVSFDLQKKHIHTCEHLYTWFKWEPRIEEAKDAKKCWNEATAKEGHFWISSRTYMMFHPQWNTFSSFNCYISTFNPNSHVPALLHLSLCRLVKISSWGFPSVLFFISCGPLFQ